MSAVFVLINVALDKEQEIFNELDKISEIKELHLLRGGIYDLIARIEAENSDEIETITIMKIKTVEGVVDAKVFTELEITKPES